MLAFVVVFCEVTFFYIGGGNGFDRVVWDLEGGRSSFSVVLVKPCVIAKEGVVVVLDVVAAWLFGLLYNMSD